MRWPDIFFKSRKPKLPETSPGTSASKATLRMPGISELEKSVDPAAAKSTEKTQPDKITAESLRALSESGHIRFKSPEPKAPSQGSAITTKLTVPPLAASSPVSPVTGALPSDITASGNVSFRRRAKMADVARVLPDKIEDAAPKAPPSPETKPLETPSAAVIPAAFSVAVAAGSVIENKAEEEAKTDASVSESRSASVLAEKTDSTPSTAFKPGEEPPLSIETPAPSKAFDFSTSLKDTTRVTLPASVTTSAAPSPSSTSIEPVKPSSESREKREFVLANGERILGHILSETADTIYLDHLTLGVLTLPRAQIAKKPIEVILINGDRVVGDLIAETSECMYIRHASLGMLTVPHGQRSTRVVEAILKDGDRILGEVLAETENFTVIRSATLGTVAVQHEQVAMLNRKIEQMQLRALPSPALEDQKPERNSS